MVTNITVLKIHDSKTWNSFLLMSRQRSTETFGVLAKPHVTYKCIKSCFFSGEHFRFPSQLALGVKRIKSSLCASQHENILQLPKSACTNCVMFLTEHDKCDDLSQQLAIWRAAMLSGEFALLESKDIEWFTESDQTTTLIRFFRDYVALY